MKIEDVKKYLGIIEFAVQQVQEIDMDDIGDPEDPFLQGTHMGRQSGAVEAWETIIKHCAGKISDS